MYFSRTDGPAPLSASLHGIPDGREGTIATLKIMRDVARKGKESLSVRTLATQLAATVPPKDWVGEVKAVHKFVRDKIRYVKDIRGIETIQIPEVTLQLKSGDCDDKSILVASLLETIGHPVRFVAIGFKPDDFVHVYPETRIGTKWVSVETTEPVEIGWTPKNIVSRLIINV